MSKARPQPSAKASALSALDAQIGARLRDARLAVILTQEDAAAALGEDRTTLVRWERGQRRPTVYDLLRLSRLYGVAARDLIDLEQPLPRTGRAEGAGTPHAQARALIETFLTQRPDLLPQVVDLLAQLADGASLPLQMAHSEHDGVIARLRGLDIDRLAPLDALNVLAELRGLLNERR